MTNALSLRVWIEIIALGLVVVIGVILQPRAIVAFTAVVGLIVAVCSVFLCCWHATRTGTRILRWLVASVGTILLATLLLAVGGVVTYTAALGSFPSAEVFRFVTQNFSMIPAHLLQTAPALTTSVTVLSILTALILARWAGRIVRSYTVPSATRSALLAITASVTVGAMGSIYDTITPPPSVDLRDPAVTDFLDSLPTISTLPESEPLGFPVVVILVESLRHDLLMDYPEAVPFLRELAQQGITFDHAYATASHSNLTDLAFWYSQYPLRGPGKEAYPIDAPWRGVSLFGAFKDAGYTIGYVSSQNERWGEMINWLDTTEMDHFFHSEHFSGQTWENMDDAPGLASLIKKGIATAGKIEDSQTLKIAGDWLASQPRAKPIFLGMNLQNTHYSYVIPPGGSEPYQPSELGFKAVYYSWPEDKAPEVRNRYLNAVTNVDRLLAEFADRLKEIGIWEECLFVVVGDNGEGFYEHGFGNHSGPMYDEAVRTIAVVKPPKSLELRPLAVDKPISHIDIAAMVGHLAGISLPGSFQGQPILGSSQSTRPVYMYSNAIVRQFGIVDWPWKYLLTEHPHQKEELYNLANDPAERQERSKQEPAVRDRLRDALMFWRKAQTRYYTENRFENQKAPDFNFSNTSLYHSVGSTVPGISEMD